MSIKFYRITPVIGAEVIGINLQDPLSADQQKILADALHTYQVLFFRDQIINPVQQRDFAKQFGELHIHPIYPKTEAAAEVLVLDSTRNDLRDNAIWHTDVTFIQTPPLGCILSAKQVPEFGGDTLWSSGFAAFNGLSPRLQQLLDGLTATHDFAYSFPPERYGTTPEALAQWEQAKRHNPPVSHPVIRIHPVTGQKALFVNEGFTTHINELPKPESDLLLGFLFQHITKPEYTVRWRWRAGDVAFWDNRSTQHYASDNYHGFQRIMHRATILGDKPY